MLVNSSSLTCLTDTNKSTPVKENLTLKNTIWGAPRIYYWPSSLPVICRRLAFLYKFKYYFICRWHLYYNNRWFKYGNKEKITEHSLHHSWLVQCEQAEIERGQNGKLLFFFYNDISRTWCPASYKILGNTPWPPAKLEGKHLSALQEGFKRHLCTPKTDQCNTILYSSDVLILH